MALIKINDLVKKYHEGKDIELTVLKEISLEIDSGDFVSIMGPSGSGKSTLMHLLGFLDTPTSGDYWLEGIQTSNFNENKLSDIRNQKIGFVFQAFHLLPRTTALENVMLPMMYAGVSDREQRKRATEVLESVGLGDRLDHTPAQLSGGQQQRVSIARALINNPKVIFADEPTGNLDTESSYEIMAILERLNDEGKTIIMVTHEEDIAAYTKRLILLRDGEVTDDKKNKIRKNAKEALKDWKEKKSNSTT